MKLAAPLVTVIIPTYNRAQFIRESIQSVLSQTFSDLEVIVVDDGSTDDTAKIIEAISSPKLIYIRQANRGRSYARNHALSLARGKFIAFLDSDDVFLPNKIELQVDYLTKHPGTGMVYTSAYCIDSNGAMINERYKANDSGLIYEKIAFFSSVTITLPTVMTYKAVLDHIGGFDENMHRFEDTDLWRRISKAYRIDAMDEYTCKLRTHDENSIVNQNPEQIVEALNYYANKIIRDDPEIALSIRRKGLAALYRYYSRALFSVPRFAPIGRKLLHTAYDYDPLLIRLFNKTKAFLRPVLRPPVVAIQLLILRIQAYCKRSK